MEFNDLEILSHIYNSMLAIDTKGQSTIIMAECLQSLRNFILTKDNELKQKNKSEEG